MKRTSFILALCLSLCMAGLAQRPYTIYPVPHEQHAADACADFTQQVSIVAEAGIDKVTVQRAVQILEEHGLVAVVTEKAPKEGSCLLLGVNASKGVADKAATKQQLCRKVFEKEKYDRHILSLTADKAGHAQVVILGENTDAVFCGLASLEQMLDRGTLGLPCVTLYDYADLKDRGVIEGYYGVPYSAAVTKDLFRLMARFKMNCYMYGAKSDPYHSRYWAEPYPTTITPEQERIGYLTQQMLSDITAVATASKVNFIWAIHPGQAFTNADNKSVLSEIMRKFEAMHALGVRQFGVFVDDVGVPDDAAMLRLGADRLTELQARIDDRWNTASAAPADTVKPLHYVPQLYAFSWVSREKGKRFFESLKDVPAKVNIYITGRNVWSVPNTEDLAIVRDWMGREASWWWNYPCNDNDMTKLFPMDMYSNFRDEKHIANLARLEPALSGTHTLILNPMQQGEISKIALFSAADYAWNNAAFDNQQSWEAALPAVVGEKYAPALRTVAPYLRYYDEDALAYLTGAYKNGQRDFPGALAAELRRVNAACRTLEGLRTSARESDRLFYDDVRPWLLKLRDMTAEAAARIEGKEAPDFSANEELYHFPILNGMGEDIKIETREAEPAARVLEPLLQWLRERQAQDSGRQ
ncbi:MAG: beta-N-acetylglucosaminidase domain-containing protein [Alloprevotella sp.]|nr:beta-N-acetylglucosaminidase domain-containing protein [Alloprevotella sp.]